MGKQNREEKETNTGAQRNCLSQLLRGYEYEQWTLLDNVTYPNGMCFTCGMDEYINFTRVFAFYSSQ